MCCTPSRRITEPVKGNVLRSFLVDLGTRHGLKQVHSNFDKIHKKLDAAFVNAQSGNSEKLMGGIVGIWAKMCTDSILSEKLLKEGKVLFSTGEQSLNGLCRLSVEDHACP